MEVYDKAKLPLFIKNNIYYNDAIPPEIEQENIEASGFNPEIKLVEENGDIFLHLRFDQAFFDFKTEIITTEALGKAKIPNAPFDNPDGSDLIIDNDYLGEKRSGDNTLAGPFVNLGKGKLKLKVW